MLQQLSPQDASFIFMEATSTPMHVGGVGIYTPEATPADSDKDPERTVLRYFEERLHLNPVARQRLVRVPFDADYPYWIEDADFDLEYHVRRIALPRPHDWQALLTVTERIFARPLDMNKPLWEAYVIEGLDRLEGVAPGSFAMLTKTHHAAVDGTSGTNIFTALHDLDPNAAPPSMPSEPWRPDPMPHDAELMFRSAANNFMQPLRFAQSVGRTFKSLANSGTTAIGNPADRLISVPKSRFNSKITPHRVVGTTNFDLSEIKLLRKAVPGATVNDAVLAICGGALRKYLESKNELPRRSLVAMAPINTRSSGGEDDGGNHVSAMLVPFGTNEADPIKRLAQVHASTAADKAMNKAVGAHLLTDYSRFVPAATAALAGRLMGNLADAPTQPFNITITNVPGPQIPIYAMGAKMAEYMALGPITQGMGLIMPITSYCGSLRINYTTCREIIPDSEFFAQCIVAAYREFRDAVIASLPAANLGDS